MTIYHNQFQFSTNLMLMHVRLQCVVILKHHDADIIFGTSINATDFDVNVKNQNSVA